MGAIGRLYRRHQEPRGQGDTWQDKACWLLNALSKLCSLLSSTNMTHRSMLLKGITLQMLVFEIFPFVSCERSGNSCQSLSQNKSSSSFCFFSPPTLCLNNYYFMARSQILFTKWKENVRIFCSDNEKRSLFHFYPIRCIQHVAFKLIFCLTLPYMSICAPCFISSCHKALLHSQRPACNCLGVKPLLALHLMTDCHNGCTSKTRFSTTIIYERENYFL